MVPWRVRLVHCISLFAFTGLQLVRSGAVLVRLGDKFRLLVAVEVVCFAFCYCSVP